MTISNLWYVGLGWKSEDRKPFMETVIHMQITGLTETIQVAKWQ